MFVVLEALKSLIRLLPIIDDHKLPENNMQTGFGNILAQYGKIRYTRKFYL